jgi:hypothetical protein
MNCAVSSGSSSPLFRFVEGLQRQHKASVQARTQIPQFERQRRGWHRAGDQQAPAAFIELLMQSKQRPFPGAVPGDGLRVIQTNDGQLAKARQQLIAEFDHLR